MTILSITKFCTVLNVIHNFIICVLWISAICRGLITENGACRAVRFINNTRSSVLSRGKCISPEVCDCLRPHPEPNYFYPDGSYCKRKSFITCFSIARKNDPMVAERNS